MSYFSLPFVPAIGLLGSIAPAARLRFYLTGTSTLAPIYADAALTTPLANPVIANAGGRFVDIFLDNATIYRVRLETASGALIDEVDPFSASFSAPFVLPDEADGDAIPAPGSGLPYLSGGVMKIA